MKTEPTALAAGSEGGKMKACACLGFGHHLALLDQIYCSHSEDAVDAFPVSRKKRYF